MQVANLLFGFGKIEIDANDSDNECIVIVAEINVPRLERMLFYLRKIRKEKFIIISSKEKFRKEYFDRIPEVKTYLVKYPWQIGSIIKQLKNIKLIHAFESRSIFPYYALVSKPLNCRFIFDFQDLYNNYTEDKKIAGWLKENLFYEAFCLRESDAFIGYSLELNPLRRKLNLKKKPSVYFPFFVDDESIIPPQNHLKKDTINIVYAGGLAPISWNISFNMTLTEKFIHNSNVFLHLYPSPSVSDTIINEYENYSLENTNLILHKPVSNKSLSFELNQYDFAIIPFFKTDAYKAGDKYKYSTSLKLWNFIESGIPIIIMQDVNYQAWLVERMGVGKVIQERDLNNLPQILKEASKQNYSSAISKIQKTQKLSLNIHKINDLYNQLIQ